MAKVFLEANAEPDRRSQDRQKMILRVGLMEQSDRPYFCLVRNISATGIQVKLYSSALRAGDVVVRVADEDPIAGQIVWVRNGNAGIRFANSMDPATLLRVQQKLGPARRRSMPRVKATSYAVLRVGGRMISAVLRDVSNMGARISTSRPLQVGTRATVRLPDLPELKAYVRWTDRDEAGLLFEAPLPMQVIAEWVDGRMRTAV